MLAFPQQDIPETQKDQKWCSKVLDYAVFSFDNNRGRRIQKMNKLFGSFTGTINEEAIKFLTQTYGKKFRGSFIPFRIAKPKMDLLWGEFLSMPLNSTVSSVSPEAKSKKLDRFHIQMGLMEAAEEVQKLRDEAGIDVFNGMPIPDKNDPNVFEKMRTTDIMEMLGQIWINDGFKREDFRTKFSQNFRDVMIVSECFGKTEIKGSDNQVGFRNIDARNAVFEEIEGDPFLEKTPYIGERRYMYLHDILAEFPELTTDQKKILNSLPGSYKQYNDRPYYRIIDNQLAIEVFMIEWKSIRPLYFLNIPNPKDPSAPPYKKMISPEDWENPKKQKQYQRNLQRYGGELEVKYTVDIWEGVRIGHNPALDVRCRRKPFQIRSMSNPTETKYSYTGLLFGTVDSVRTSIWELTENLGYLYDVILFQINRELAKNKGKIVVYDKAFLPKGSSMKDVFYDMSQEQVMVINTAQDGKRDVSINGQLKEVDLGLSASMSILINLKIEIKRTIDEITSINENRMGETSASETATNATNNINASMTVTYPMFYFMNRYIENVLSRYVEYKRMVAVYYGDARAENIIGDAGIKFFKITKDMLYEDLGIYVSDGKKEQKIRETINRLAETSLNAKELRIQDVFDVEVSETIAGARQALVKGWEAVKNQALQEQQASAQAQQKQLETQLQIAREDREDRQAHEKEGWYVKAGLDREKQTQEASNRLVEQNHQASNDEAKDMADRVTGRKRK